MVKKKKQEIISEEKAELPKEKPAVSKKSKASVSSGQGSILIVTEKPQAAEKIAAALSNGKDDKIKDKNGVAYYELVIGGRRVVIGCAVGHLFGIKQNEARGGFPNFDVSWKPNFQSKGMEYTKRYYDVLKKLSKDVNEVIVATDYDVEGEVIGWNVVRFICGKENEAKAKRMKFSSLTKDELLASWEHLEPHLNWGEAYAGETRHFLDWFYGINLSRGLMKALSSTGKFRILSIGRVQGPALKIIYDKELEIKDFKSTPYWQIFIRVKDLNKQKLELKYPKDLTKETELARFKFLKGQKGIAKTNITEDKIDPPFPFDLTTLQTESYRYFGLTPSQTLSIAQKLYLEGVISYPRTSSQKYIEGIGFEKILTALKKYTQLTKYAVNKKPTEGPKSDPAHPAIYPTGESGKELGELERKVYDLIVKRFISCFAEPAIVENTKVTVAVNGLDFHAKGIIMKQKNWLNVYPNNYKDEEIVIMNGEVQVEEIRTEEKMTKPPARYNAASLVKELEKRDLGTKATRANIIETLYSRGYIQEKSIEISPLGMRIIETLLKHSPIIIDEELTRSFEKEMEEISSAKEDFGKKEEKMIDKAKISITKIAGDITKHMKEIGEALAEANEEVYEQQRQDSILGTCPNCKQGNLKVMFGKKFRRYFVGCDKYPECKTIFSLPPQGLMKPAKAKDKTEAPAGTNPGEQKEVHEMCPECNFPMILALKKGKRPWKFCFNPKCKSNEEWVKKKEEYKEKMQAENKAKEKADGKPKEVEYKEKSDEEEEEKEESSEEEN